MVNHNVVLLAQFNRITGHLDVCVECSKENFCKTGCCGRNLVGTSDDCVVVVQNHGVRAYAPHSMERSQLSEMSYCFFTIDGHARGKRAAKRWALSTEGRRTLTDP